MAVTQLMSAEEFLALPETEHSRFWNLVAGEVVVNQPTGLHSLLQARTFAALNNWVDAGERRGRLLFPIALRLDGANVFAPDLLWYSDAREFAPRSRPPYPLPDLAVEVRSPSTWRYDIGAKKSTYERHGLPELWLVDTVAEQVLVFRRRTPATVTFDVSLELGRGDVLESPLLPGFALALDDLFDVD